jgi:flagellar motor switch protein FliM
MPAQLNIVQESDGAGDSVTSPEHPAIQASPDIVGFAKRTHQAFLEALQSKLTAALGSETRASFIGTEQSFMARYLTDAEPGIHNIALSLEPLAGCALLRFSSELLFRVLDILLASPAGAVGPRSESVTEIELHVLRGFFRVFSDALKESWRSVPPVALTRLPENSEESSAAGYGDSHSLAMKSMIEIDGAGGDFYVVIPAYLARLSAKLSRNKPDEGALADSEPSVPARIADALGSAKVDIDAVLSNLTIRIGDLLELAPGQILLAEKTADSIFECLVNKSTRLEGELVSADDHYGFQLSRADVGDKEAGSPADR